MTDFPFDIVGFDLDGTLLDTSGDLTAAVNHTLALAGKPLLTIAEVKPMIGGGAKMMLEHGLKASGGIAEEEFRPLYRAMMAYYADHVSVHTRPFPGAVALLDQLDALGVRYGIVTNINLGVQSARFAIDKPRFYSSRFDHRDGSDDPRAEQQRNVSLQLVVAHLVEKRLTL